MYEHHTAPLLSWPAFLARLARHGGYAAALVSAMSERPIPSEAVVLGEIALSGEIRPVAHAPLRLKESAKLGFEQAWVPGEVKPADGISAVHFANLRGLVDQILGR
jgi:DNA repair protein RadA/Sms